MERCGPGVGDLPIVAVEAYEWVTSLVTVIRGSDMVGGCVIYVCVSASGDLHWVPVSDDMGLPVHGVLVSSGVTQNQRRTQYRSIDFHRKVRSRTDENTRN